jgi:hypothetical protein
MDVSDFTRADTPLGSAEPMRSDSHARPGANVFDQPFDRPLDPIYQ